METVTRNTSYKVWISDLISGNFIKGSGQFDSGYIEIKENKISRVNLVGGIVDKSIGENYVSVNLDDGSGILKLKVWNEGTSLFLGVNVGDLVLVVGKVRDYNNSIYVTPEIVRKLDNSLWLKIRKLELVKSYGEPTRVESEVKSELTYEQNEEESAVKVTEEKVNSNGNSRELLISLIESLDSGDGADVTEVLRRSGMGEARTLVDDLIRNGEIFELHKDKLRVIG